MMNPNPACRPTAQQSLAKFIALQSETPDWIRFAPEKGYRDMPSMWDTIKEDIFHSDAVSDTAFFEKLSVVTR